jgi:hypothetical protein
LHNSRQSIDIKVKACNALQKWNLVMVRRARTSVMPAADFQRTSPQPPKTADTPTEANPGLFILFFGRNPHQEENDSQGHGSNHDSRNGKQKKIGSRTTDTTRDQIKVSTMLKAG